jgi:hypothetical protein
MTPSKTVLKRTQGILQRTHDYIEAEGFNITVAITEEGSKADFKKGRKGKAKLGPCCYIGGVRLAAGVDPDWAGVATDKGDGPELTLALEVMDQVVARSKDAAAARIRWYSPLPGKLAEALGFALRVQGVSNENQKARALTLLRRALRDVYKKLEAAS